MILKALLVILTMTACYEAYSTTKIYKVVKPDGTIVYTDTPPPGATEFKLVKQPNLMPSMASNKQPMQSTNTQASSVSPTLTLLTPAHESTVRSNAGEVSIKASIEPEVTGLFVLHLNNQVHARNAAPVFELNDLPRGQYQIKIEYLDQSGKLLASTQPSTFYLHKASALILAN